MGEEKRKGIEAQRVNPPPQNPSRAPMRTEGMKKMEEKKDRGTEGETPHPNPALDALIGDEEQTR